MPRVTSNNVITKGPNPAVMSLGKAYTLRCRSSGVSVEKDASGEHWSREKRVVSCKEKSKG